MDKRLIIVLISLLLVGCQSTSTKVVPLPQLCVIQQGEVRADFSGSLLAGLKARQIPYVFTKEISGCEWLLTYRASWVWPYSAYLASAELSFSRPAEVLSMRAYSALEGRAIARVDKWIDAWIASGICENPAYHQAIEAAVVSRPWFDLLSQESLPCPSHHL